MFNPTQPLHTNAAPISSSVSALVRTLSNAAAEFPTPPKLSAAIPPTPVAQTACTIATPPRLNPDEIVYGSASTPAAIIPAWFANPGFVGSVYVGNAPLPAAPTVNASNAIAPPASLASEPTSAPITQPTTTNQAAAFPPDPNDPTHVCVPQNIYKNDFESLGSIGDEWSSQQTSVTPRLSRRFLGEFGEETVTLTLDNIPDNATITLSTDLYIIRSWDGADGPPYGPDYFTAAVLGGEVLSSKTYSNRIGEPMATEGFKEANTMGYYFDYSTTGERPSDSVYTITKSFIHTTGASTFSLAGSGLQSLHDESWGIDNIQIDICAPPIVFDLSVNGDNDLTDVGVDLAANYMPGYEGDRSAVSSGTIVNDHQYTGQRMKLVVDGIGKFDANITRIEFEITEVSKHDGYASNMNDLRFGSDNNQDYSFSRDKNDRIISIKPDSMEDAVNGYGGGMDNTSTWVNFWCKDYGASGTVEMRVFVKDGAGEKIDETRTKQLRVPVDTDQDGLADKWEIAMGRRWTTQYALAPSTDEQALAHFHTRLDANNKYPDAELRDPDNRGTELSGLFDVSPVVAQKEIGDAHDIVEEYRGYVLDGGGWQGNGLFAPLFAHRGGHIRLDPARKEVLVEVDHSRVLNNVPGVADPMQTPMQQLRSKLQTILNGASGVFGHPERGAGILMYYQFNQTVLMPKYEDVDTPLDLMNRLGEYRSAALQSDFLHLLLINETDFAEVKSSAVTYTQNADPTATRNKFGSVIATTTTEIHFPANQFPMRVEFFATTIAHELTHLLIEKRNGGFVAGEHTFNSDQTDPPRSPRDEPCIMHDETVRANREYATVKFSRIVQQEITTRTSEGLVQQS